MGSDNRVLDKPTMSSREACTQKDIYNEEYYNTYIPEGHTLLLNENGVPYIRESVSLEKIEGQEGFRLYTQNEWVKKTEELIRHKTNLSKLKISENLIKIREKDIHPFSDIIAQ